jgi:hypothetical protein
LDVVTRDGRTLAKRLLTYRGTPENPASTQEVEDKARELVLPVIGKARTEQLIQCVKHLEQVKDMRELRANFVAIEQNSISSEQGGQT